MSATERFHIQTRNEMVEWLGRVIDDLTTMTYLAEVNRTITFAHPDGRLFRVSVEAEWPRGQEP